MKIYGLSSDVDTYKSVSLKDESESRLLLDLLDQFGGPMIWDWPDKKMRLAIEPLVMNAADRERPLSDIPNLGSQAFPVFSRRAVEALRPLIAMHCEFLPLACDEGEYFLVNIRTVVDALDRERSAFKTFRGSNRIMEMQRYEFIEKRIGSVPIFRLPDDRTGRFVTDPFVEAVEKAGLEGFEFPLLWSSESGGVEIVPLAYLDKPKKKPAKRKP